MSVGYTNVCIVEFWWFLNRPVHDHQLMPARTKTLQPSKYIGCKLHLGLVVRREQLQQLPPFDELPIALLMWVEGPQRSKVIHRGLLHILRVDALIRSFYSLLNTLQTDLTKDTLRGTT